MRHRGKLSTLLVFVLGLWLAGCSRPPQEAVRSAPQAKVEPPPGTYGEQGSYGYQAEDEGGGDICKIDPQACPKLKAERARPIKEAIYAVQQVAAEPPELELTGPLAGAPAVRGSSELAMPSPERSAPQPKATEQVEMRDIEAKLELVVENLPAAVSRVRALINQAGGQIVSDVIKDNASEYGAALSLRVPAAKTFGVLDQLAALGKLRSREVESADIGRKYLDAQIVERNLRLTLKRYEELLAKADSLKDMVELEAALARTRTEIDRVEGDLRWMADRVARSTIYVTLSTEDPEAGVIAPSPKLWPGLRAFVIADYTNAESLDWYSGGGLSFLISRSFGFDLDIARELTDDDAANWIQLGAGGDLYSNLLGAGKRRFFNPYLGFRVAYVYAEQVSELGLGGNVGLEIYRGSMLLVDTQLRAQAVMGSKAHALHLALQPTLSVSAAF
jgi:hypothetical protein